MIGYDTSVILINVGNSHTQIASAGADGIHILQTVATSSLCETGFASFPVPVAAASVVPAVTEKLKEIPGCFLVSPESFIGLDFSRMDSSTVGADRIANALLVAEEYLLPAVVIDFGTAITMEVVDCERHFLGGAIAPGRKLMRMALAGGTAQLPQLPLGDLLMECRPGCNTREAMEFGVDHGAIGMVKEWLRAMDRHFSGTVQSWLGIGGDAAFFLPELPMLQPGGNDFTLRGIYKAWQNRKVR